MKGTKVIIQIVLIVVVGFLAYMLYSSIMEPVKFETVKKQREAVIIDKLMNIKELQIEYKNIHSEYAPNFDSLIKFYEYGQMAVVLKIGTNDTLTEERALELKLISRDTSYVAIKDTLLLNVENFNINTISVVPFTNGKVHFKMESALVDRSNFKVPVFEVSCLMKDYLSDIEQQDYLNNLLLQMKEDSKFPGLKLGSMEDPSTDGNWQ